MHESRGLGDVYKRQTVGGQVYGLIVAPASTGVKEAVLYRLILTGTAGLLD